MRIFIILLTLLMTPSQVFAVPIVQHFSPQPRIELPTQVAGAGAGALKKYEKELARRILRKPDDPYLTHKLGRVLYHQGRVDEAMRAWKRASEKEPNLAPANLMADLEEIFALLAKNDIKLAQKKLIAAHKKYKNNPHFYLSQGEQAMRSSNFTEAEKAYKKAYELGPNLYTTSLNLARFYEFRKDHKEARKYYLKAAELAPKRAECWTYLGNHQFRQGQVMAALKSFRRAKENDGDEPSAEIQLAKLSYKIRDYLGTRRWYKAALQQNPENKNAILAALSDVQLRLGLMDEAYKDIKTILKTDELVPLLVAMGTIEESRGKPEEAEKYYRRALKKQPDNVIAGNNLAMVLVRMNKSSQEALELARKVHDRMPKNPKIFGTYACALYMAGKHKEARRVLPQAIRINPGDAWLRYLYGKLLLKNKQLKEGLYHLEGVLILDPEFPHKAEIQKLLKISFP